MFCVLNVCDFCVFVTLVMLRYGDGACPNIITRVPQDVDAQFMAWRHNHTLVVQRVIGAKPGSGGSSGYQYVIISALAPFFVVEKYPR